MTRYKVILVKFMAFKDGAEYANNHEFTTEALLRITPDDLCRWMNKRAFNDPEPRDEMKPVFARSTTLEFAKKAISSFMPRVNMTWDPITAQGNPTRSDAVNKLIKRVKRFEVRREGVSSNARRSIEFDEFINLLSLVRSEEERGGTRYLVGSALTLQWHIMARIDDMMKLQFSNFMPNPQYPSTLLCQVRWSKNVLEERDAPEQIVFGSMDPRMCALLNMAVYIETSANAMHSEFLYGNSSDGDRVVRRFIKDMFKKPAFKKLKEGHLGTHSLRKGAATYCSRCGISKDFVNRRGRWRTRKAVVDVYIDNTQPYPDACTAAALAGPAGPCIYAVKTGIASVEPCVLVNEIAPTIKRVMGEAIAATLALPLLWAALEPLDGYKYNLLPDQLKQRIVLAYTNAGGNRAFNPVQRDAFYVLGDGSQLNLVVVDGNKTSEQGDSTRGIDGSSRTGISGGDGTRQDFAAIHSQLLASRRYMTEVMNEVQRSRRELQREMKKVQAVLRRVVMQPVARPAGAVHEVAPQTTGAMAEHQRVSLARLSKRPKDLFELWHEYQFGLAGLKAAKDFSPAERGANKYAYSRRKVFWDVVANLVRSGYTSDSAIDKVYAVYGSRLSVSSVLVNLRADRKSGTQHSLR